jgi:iron complex outermembrane receptor protein
MIKVEMKQKFGTSVTQAALLCSISFIALAAGSMPEASAQATLPAVTVDTPKPQTRARNATTTRSRSAARATRRASERSPAQSATAPSVNDRIYAGDHGYVAGTAGSASKTNTPLIDTPRSVSVIDRKELDDRGVSNVVEAVRYTAGIATGTFGFDPRFDSIMLRGFPAVTFGDFRDGLRQYGGSFGAYRTEPFQLSSIEVIKGPAAVLYGQSVPGGLIDRRSKLPVDNQVNEISLQGGTYGRMQTAFDIGGANSDKSLLYRLVGLGRAGNTNYDIADERLLLAPSLTWRPTIDTTLTAYAILQKDETDGSVAMINRGDGLLNINGQTVKLRTSDPKYDYMRVEQAQVGFKLEHRFDDVFTFRQHTRFGALHAATRYLGGSFGTPTSTIFNRYPVSIGDDQRSWQTDNVLQADFATGPIVHKTLFGVNYDYNVWDFKLGFGGVNPAYALDVLHPVYGLVGTTTPYTSASHSKQDQVGIYLQDQMRLGNWHLSLSGRQDWANRTLSNALTGTETGARNDKAFSYSAGLLYHFDTGIAPYVS